MSSIKPINSSSNIKNNPQKRLHIDKTKRFLCFIEHINEKDKVHHSKLNINKTVNKY